MKILIVSYLCFIFVMAIVTLGEADSFAVTPKQIYELNDCNMLAAILLWFFEVVTNPILVLCRFLYWLFHFGRKNEF